MANVSSNLILFKARQQYGLRVFSEIGLVIFIAVLVLHIFVHTYEMALFARVVAGLAGAPLSSLGMYYTMQAFKKADMAKGIYIAFGFQQLGVPLAWIISRVGQYVAAGSQLLYLIPQQTWVIANFKETQIANMRIGQKAWFTVDAMKHKKFTGHVEQISLAAGSEFSVLTQNRIMQQETLPKSFNELPCVLPLTQIRKEWNTYALVCQ